MPSRRIWVGSWCGFPVFAVLGVGRWRLALGGHRIAARPGIGSASSAFLALMPYRVAADVLKQVFPIDAGKDPETVRRHTLKIGEALPIVPYPGQKRRRRPLR